MSSRANAAMPSMTQVRSGGVRMDHEKTEKTMMEVTIFGLTLKIRGDADPELTLKLAEFVDQKMREAVPSTMNWTNVLLHERLARVAILAALNIAEELFQLRAEKEMEKNLVEEKASALLTLLEKELQPSEA
jgi:cell division protein ZapA (FtsZ GTPase activity inhibitor)